MRTSASDLHEDPNRDCPPSAWLSTKPKRPSMASPPTARDRLGSSTKNGQGLAVRGESNRRLFNPAARADKLAEARRATPPSLSTHASRISSGRVARLCLCEQTRALEV